MTLESILAILTTVFGGSSVITGYMLWQNRKANAKSADALAHTEEANSLKVTGEVFKLLTEITKNEVAGLKQQMEKQTQEIFMLKKIVDEYKLKCGNCTINNTK